MGWNKPSVASVPAPTPKRKPTALRGAVAGFIVVAVAAVVAFVLLSGGDAKPKAKCAKKPAAIKEVKPATVSKAESVSEAKPPREEKPVAKSNVNGLGYPGFLSWRKKRHAVITNYVGYAQSSNRVFKSVAEQVLLGIFSKELGDQPASLPRLPVSEQENLLFILLDKNPIAEKDAPEVAVAKETLQLAKDELKQYLKDGGDADTFFEYYHDKLVDAYYKRKNALSMLEEMCEHREDLEVVKAFRDKANKMLVEDGIKPIELTADNYTEEELKAVLKDEYKPEGEEMQ